MPDFPLFLAANITKRGTHRDLFPDPVGQSGSAWVGVFRDEFDNGTVPNWFVWADHLVEGDSFRTNDSPTEVQWYPHNKRGLSVANSVLTLTARNESPYVQDPLCPNPLPSGQVGTWTSGMIQSHPGFNFTYGYAEARIRHPAAVTGQWPAFWTSTSDSVWPPEIDIAEFFDGNNVKYNFFKDDSTTFSSSQAFTPDGLFHVWAVDWNASGSTFYLDGAQVATTAFTSASATPQHLIFNFAVRSGAGAGPWAFDIDYVRVWQRVGSPQAPVITSITPASGIPVSGQIAVNFTSVPGATSYRVSPAPVDSRADGVTTSSHLTATGASSPITITGLTNGARYTVSVAALNSVGYSIESALMPTITG